MQKKLLITLAALMALVALPFANKNIAYAVAPTGTLTGTVITVNIGELKAMNAVTVTDNATPQITTANDIRIRIPAGVNAYWDVADTTATLTGTASAKASATVTYPDTKTVLIDVTTNFAGSDTLIVDGLSFVGHTAATAGAALEWAIDGAAPTYGTGNVNTNITVADGTVDTLTSVSATLSNAVVSTASVTYTVNFTVPTGGVITKNGKIKVTFPAGFNVASAGAGTLTGIDGTVTAAVSGQDVTLTRQNDGTNSTAGAKAVQITGVTNHATATDTYTVTATTQTSASDLLATAASAAYLVNPAAISTLTCEASGQGGAVWLRWTVPTGTTGAYESKYQQGNSITYGSASTFTQTWANGTVGVAQQQLLTGLNPNTQYTFAMKAKGAGTSISAVSTTTPICYAPGAAPAVIDTKAPVTQIASPAKGSTVSANEPLVIKGSSMDQGGSSVQYVEVSLDNGTTWNKADITVADDGNRVWQYTWAKPSAGSQKIWIRATDWVGNTETPVELSLTVSSGTVTTTPTTPVTPTTPAAPTTPESKAALIASLENQLKTLLTQLIALLTAQIQAQLAR